jgi:hypothetical protein
MICRFLWAQQEKGTQTSLGLLANDGKSQGEGALGYRDLHQVQFGYVSTPDLEDFAEPRVTFYVCLLKAKYWT